MNVVVRFTSSENFDVNAFVNCLAAHIGRDQDEYNAPPVSIDSFEAYANFAVEPAPVVKIKRKKPSNKKR
jgi:hypothetical protein